MEKETEDKLLAQLSSDSDATGVVEIISYLKPEILNLILTKVPLMDAKNNGIPSVSPEDFKGILVEAGISPKEVMK
ncbi:hypothetical protein [Lentilactobacillus senioris]|uniref:hypothetical protein n=1 Tax=Lentilactobacillus senioris TaxID=931534 RepID=UPI003D279DAA